MLPYTPMHHLLLRATGGRLVMTSGNVSEEPIAKDNDEAVQRLGRIADRFLLHDRDIYARYDDSVVRVVDGTPRMIRRARGYCPLPVRMESPGEHGARPRCPSEEHVLRAPRWQRIHRSAHRRSRQPADARATTTRRCAPTSGCSGPRRRPSPRICIPTTPRRGSPRVVGGRGPRGACAASSRAHRQRARRARPARHGARRCVRRRRPRTGQCHLGR